MLYHPDGDLDADALDVMMYASHGRSRWDMRMRLDVSRSQSRADDGVSEDGLKVLQRGSRAWI